MDKIYYVIVDGYIYPIPEKALFVNFENSKEDLEKRLSAMMEKKPL